MAGPEYHCPAREDTADSIRRDLPPTGAHKIGNCRTLPSCGPDAFLNRQRSCRLSPIDNFHAQFDAVFQIARLIRTINAILDGSGQDVTRTIRVYVDGYPEILEDLFNFALSRSHRVYPFFRSNAWRHSPYGTLS